jgi:UDP-GlcNAc:undecaprenyl-phosphate/decaprenyl-phosphate GlcNAc-1-phosphate transferase
MSIQQVSGFIALLVCLGALPIVRRLAQRFNLYDAPGPLKIHKGSIPRLGGIAMLAGFLAGGLFVYIPYLPASRLNFLPLLIFVVVWAVGLIDDVWTLGPGVRFSAHIAAGASLWFAGWRLEWFRSPLLDLPATCLFIAFLVNAMNLLDGMDGLAAGTAATASIGFLIISSGETNALEFTVASCLLGVCVAMLTVNAPPATMFMGDSGSTLIGIVLAFLSLNWVRAQTGQHSILIPLIFLSVPLADTLMAILRRVRFPRLLFQGDRRHFYDILLQREWAVDGVLRISIGVTAILVFAAWLCVRGIVGAWLTGVIVLCALAPVAYLLGSLQPESNPVQASRGETPLGSALE